MNCGDLAIVTCSYSGIRHKCVLIVDYTHDIVTKRYSAVCFTGDGMMTLPAGWLNKLKEDKPRTRPC